ncbi:MAG TPA: phosphate acetyltransferase, partial [Polyangiaceae bacterium]|nr:phosphate acetyltransferase [Polyangiaceae bacterium]
GSLGAASVREFEDRLELTAAPYGGIAGGRIVGCIVNRIPRAAGNAAAPGFVVTRPGWRVIGAIAENPELLACRTLDVARALDAEVLHQGELASRRVQKMSVLARTVPNLLGELTPGALLVTPGDRADVFVAAAMAAVNQVPLAGVVLTGGIPLPPGILELCRPALRAGLPVLSVATDTWETATRLRQMSTEVPIDDLARVERCIDFVAEQIDVDFIARHARAPVQTRVSPAAFCHRLSELARASKKRIVLPEGTEPRTIRAALICAAQGTARPVLLGDPEEVRRIAGSLELVLNDVEILDPASIRHNYVAPLVELRRHKGLTAKDAAELLEDTVWLGTMMLAAGEVDGLVSGAVHSTANTIRPALQVIKTKPGTKVVSSVFFMCLPENVVVYGDCAVNPDPDAETLADIAVQSADSAARFGITPRVAMISYSTGQSGSGSDVDKVRKATEIAQKLRPDLLIDGPLQYDAAAIADVAAQKAPGSKVAGQATVFIFPDLNTGNTTYKAVQRSAHVTSIGPMLQGMRRPVNDLSRGALVEDIVYTIALTAIQAS